MAKLTQFQKTQQIPEAISRYLKEKGSNQAQLSRVSGVSEAYISHIRAGRTHVGATPIGDKYYMQLAEIIGLNIERKVWRHFDTHYYRQMVVAIQQSRMERGRLCIDGGTGSGKSHACREYKKAFPGETYVVTCSALETTREFCVNIAESMKLETHGSTAAIVSRVIRKLTVGSTRAILLIDEAEHIKGKDGYLKVIKSLADGLERKAALVLLGMGINSILNNGAARGRALYPQTARRFSRRELCTEGIASDIVNICTEMEITSKRVHSWLVGHITNFGDLENILTEAMKESKATGRAIDVEMLNSLN